MEKTSKITSTHHLEIEAKSKEQVKILIEQFEARGFNRIGKIYKSDIPNIEYAWIAEMSKTQKL